MPIRRFPMAAATLALVLLAPSRAVADCQPAGPIEQALAAAPVAFVGTVTAVDGPSARFAVAEVWAGSVGADVEVRGLGDGGPDTGFGAGFSEDDRHWVDGATYLVVPMIDGAILRDHLCTATTEWGPDLEQLRPADARILAGEPEPAQAPPVAILAMMAAVAVIGVGALLAFRRR